MVKKKEIIVPEEDKMELKYYEITSLQEIKDFKEALKELEMGLLPFAQHLAKEQRKWWDRVLKDRELNRSDGYETDGKRIISTKERLTGQG